MRYFVILMIVSLLNACDNHAQTTNTFQGYVEGDYVRVASPIAGQLLNLLVTRGTTITQSTPLFVLEHEKEDAALAQASTALTFSKAQFDRQTKLIAKKLTSFEALDYAKMQFEQNQAQVTQLKWQLDQKTVAAPVGGLVVDTFYQIGEQIPANASVVKLLPPNNIKVRFFVPETIISILKIGELVNLHCDSCATSTATISFISPQTEFTPPVIYSKENRSKLVFLVEAKPSNDVATQLHPGEPMDVELLP